ncbi:MAG TPA: hypothetical protein VJV04_06440, partial [Nitrospiraceae bacterium]|nr:hypothetical protein [Nitrospiraceae bacterium]
AFWPSPRVNDDSSMILKMVRVSPAVSKGTGRWHPDGHASPACRHPKRKRITLVYGAADEQHNQAVVLKELLAAFT